MNLEFEEIYPKIFVYRNPWSDINLVTKTIIDSETNPEGSILKDWKGWYTFGKEVNMLNFGEGLNETRAAGEQKVWDEIIDLFYKTTEHYAKYHGLPIEKDKKVMDEGSGFETEAWKRMGPSICKYEIGGGIENTEFDLAMHMHTDYQIEYEDNRGYKFTLTCTMYLNDDYEGGGLEFLVGDNKLFYYKPKAGDILVFPAGDPNYLSDPGELYRHGVKKVYGNPKYFIRNHWTRFYEGSEEWRKNEKIYGKDIWAEMELQRVKEERKNGTYQTLDYAEIEKNGVRIQ